MPYDMPMSLDEVFADEEARREAMRFLGVPETPPASVAAPPASSTPPPAASTFDDLARRFEEAQKADAQQRRFNTLTEGFGNAAETVLGGAGVRYARSPAKEPSAADEVLRGARVQADIVKAMRPPAAAMKAGKAPKSTDPNSPESKRAQALVKATLADQFSDDEIAGMSEADADYALKYGTLAAQRQVTREGQVDANKRASLDRTQRAEIFAKQYDLDWAKLTQDQKQFLATLADKEKDRELKRDETTERGVLELSKRLENLPGMKNDLTTLVDFASKPDVPGVGATGAIPSALLTNEGVRVRQAVRGVVGALLKEQSGTAVSEGEIDRKLEELGMGKTASDREFQIGLKRLLQNTDEAMRAKEAGASPAAVQRFRERGGITSADLPQPNGPTRVPAANALPRGANGQPSLGDDIPPAPTLAPGQKMVDALKEGERVRVPMGGGRSRVVVKRNGKLKIDEDK